MTTFQSVAPLLIVDRIEPVLAFWKKLGVTPTVTVPEEGASEGRLGFAILAAADFQVMYQTSASVTADLVKAASVKSAFRTGAQQTTLYVKVASLADVERALAGEQLIMPRRTTFYGATEVAYTDPAGHIVVFAEPKASS